MHLEGTSETNETFQNLDLSKILKINKYSVKLAKLLLDFLMVVFKCLVLDQ